MAENGRIAVVGTGSWGATLAIVLARHGRTVRLLARTPEEAEILLSEGENRRFLPGVPFPLQLTVTADPELALHDASIVLVAVPAKTMRENIRALREFLPDHAVILSCAKGLEQGTLLRMSEVIAEELPEGCPVTPGALSGPNLAPEIAAGKPATTVVAAWSDEAAQCAQQVLSTPLLRVYTSSDLIGVELGGALKNIIALGAGIADGMGAGDNAKSAFITRGLAEIARLGSALGANPLTFAGLAGLGDLVATCTSPLSRNRRLGEAIARGKSLESALRELGHVAEGVGTIVAARDIAARHAVEMPITEELYRILFMGKSAREAIIDLMSREPKDELHGIATLLQQRR
ncbi:MAG: glycerol-3-phosphate dehydrogenase [NAD(P)+] [Herpetosiphonaceae bacterium]|nr:MAG: glycerol-3-phosphate dehydrogenase [NAD(P)+] [Herpetosiphonaceae bacterium]